MNRKTLLSLGSALVAVGVMSAAGYGCGDDDTATATKDSGPTINPEASPTPEGSTGPETGPMNPAPPALGAQIDRLGRPAINTALNHTFDPNAATKGAAKDAYNQDTAQAGWAATYAPQTGANLAILDGLDGPPTLVLPNIGCGNQLLAQDAGVASPTNLQVYGPLAGVTADDRLWLNTAGATCTTYLAVEANATKILVNTDCGGRGLAYDVIDVTYSVAAVGSVAGVTDGVSADATKTGGTTFPFLAPAQ
jgi:hypothetical protein